MNKIAKIKIADIGHTVTGKTPSSNNPEDFGSEYMFVTPSDSFDSKMMNTTERYLSEEGVSKLSNKLLPPKSIMITCIGSAMGKVSMNKTSCITNQQINSIIPSKNYYQDYIYYSIKNNYKLLRNASTGSTALPLLNKTDFDLLELPIHTNKETQQKIAAVLSALDSKIELNNRINAELEAMAKTLYDYWFVQFDFPDENGKPYKTNGGAMVWNKELKREIPKSWEVKQIGEFGEFKNGINYDPSLKGDTDAKIINVRNISSSNLFVSQYDLDTITLQKSKVDNYLVTDKDILIARSGIPGATRMMFEFAKNTIYCGFIIRFQVNLLANKNYLFYFLKDMEKNTTSKSGGTIMPNVNQETMKRMLVIAPNEKLISEFNEFINPVFSKMNGIIQENQTLTDLRDWLLPMLMNGQVKVI
jgi:type I restriction enzyme S subunit